MNSRCNKTAFFAICALMLLPRPSFHWQNGWIVSMIGLPVFTFLLALYYKEWKVKPALILCFDSMQSPSSVPRRFPEEFKTLGNILTHYNENIEGMYRCLRSARRYAPSYVPEINRIIDLILCARSECSGNERMMSRATRLDNSNDGDGLSRSKLDKIDSLLTEVSRRGRVYDSKIEEARKVYKELDERFRREYAN